MVVAYLKIGSHVLSMMLVDLLVSVELPEEMVSAMLFRLTKVQRELLHWALKCSDTHTEEVEVETYHEGANYSFQSSHHFFVILFHNGRQYGCHGPKKL